MPSFFNRSHSPPKAVKTGLPDLKTVGFPPAPVTSVSRELSNYELWPLYHFERHARSCSACQDAYEVHRSGSHLCQAGHALAQDVAGLIYSRGDGTKVYAAGDSDQLVRIEIPRGYGNVRSLLRAMERSLRHRRQTPIVSMDKNYYVAPRMVASSKPKSSSMQDDIQDTLHRHSSVSHSSSRHGYNSSSAHKHRHHSPSNRRHHSPQIVEWPEDEEREPLRGPLPNIFGSSKDTSEEFNDFPPPPRKNGSSSSSSKRHSTMSSLAPQGFTTAVRTPGKYSSHRHSSIYG